MKDRNPLSFDPTETLWQTPSEIPKVQNTVTAESPQEERHYPLIDLGILPPLLTIGETMALLRVSRATVYRLMGNGSIPSTYVGRSRRIPTAGLIRQLEGGMSKTL